MMRHSLLFVLTEILYLDSKVHNVLSNFYRICSTESAKESLHRKVEKIIFKIVNPLFLFWPLQRNPILGIWVDVLISCNFRIDSSKDKLNFLKNSSFATNLYCHQSLSAQRTTFNSFAYLNT